MSTFWIHRESGTVAVDDAVLKGIDTSSLPKNIQLVWWYGANGEIRYTDDDRLPIREPMADLEPFIPIFNNWILAAKTPLPTTSGKTMPAITLDQAKRVKSNLVDGLYHNKTVPATSDPVADMAAAVNNSGQAFAQSLYDSHANALTNHAHIINVGVPAMINAGQGQDLGALGGDFVFWPLVGGPTGDPLAAMRNTHKTNINAQTTVDGVAAYDITAGW